MPTPIANIVLVCPRHKLRLVHSNTPGSGEMFSCPSAGCPVACSVGSAIVDAAAFEAEGGRAARAAINSPATNCRCVSPTPARRPIPVTDPTDWEAFVDEVDELLDSGGAEWARETLEGIRTTVSDREHVTDRQAEAVRNIAEKCR